MSDKIKFLDKEYTEADLNGMDDAALLELRNLVASNLGVPATKGFKDHDTAVSQTWKALQKYDANADDGGEGGEAKPKKTKAKKEPTERKLAKPAEAQHVKRPTRDMFSTMHMKKPFDGEEERSHRSPNYKDGMMVIDAIEGVGTMAWDIYNWEKQGYVEVRKPTDDEYSERRKAWYEKHGRKDPELEKEEKAKAKAEEKAKRDAEREAKKAEKAKADAEAKAKADAE